jgi:hypothetical protein
VDPSTRVAKEDDMFHSGRTNRRAATTLIAAMALSTVCLIGGAGSVDAQGAPKKPTLVGSWSETVTFPPEFGRPPLKSLSSYHSDETMSCTDQGNVTLDPPNVYSACHGAWKQLDKLTYAYTSVELISDLSGNLVGSLKFRGVYTLSSSGNEYTGTTLADVLDTDGNVLASVEVANTGERIQVELP